MCRAQVVAVLAGCESVRLLVTIALAGSAQSLSHFVALTVVFGGSLPLAGLVLLRFLEGVAGGWQRPRVAVFAASVLAITIACGAGPLAAIFTSQKSVALTAMMRVGAAAIPLFVWSGQQAATCSPRQLVRAGSYASLTLTLLTVMVIKGIRPNAQLTPWLLGLAIVAAQIVLATVIRHRPLPRRSTSTSTSWVGRTSVTCAAIGVILFGMYWGDAKTIAVFVLLGSFILLIVAIGACQDSSRLLLSVTFTAAGVLVACAQGLSILIGVAPVHGLASGALWCGPGIGCAAIAVHEAALLRAQGLGAPVRTFIATGFLMALVTTCIGVSIVPLFEGAAVVRALAVGLSVGAGTAASLGVLAVAKATQTEQIPGLSQLLPLSVGALIGAVGGRLIVDSVMANLGTQMSVLGALWVVVAMLLGGGVAVVAGLFASHVGPRTGST